MADSQPHVDLIFPAHGTAIPRDHGYALYAAVSRVVPSVHGAKDVGIFPVKGTSAGDGTLLLTERSAVRLRLPADKLPSVLPLAGKVLEVDGHRLRLDVPRVAALVPAAVLSSPFVLIKIAHADAAHPVTPEMFLAAARKKLSDMGIGAEAGLQANCTGPKAGEVRRRVIRVKDQTHAGYAMIVQGLTAEESILLQERGLGGRRGMGCGLFLPVGRGR